MARSTLSIALALVWLGSLVNAHFILNYPTSRGFDEDTEPQFCNGFPTNATGRHPFPLSGPAPVTITSAHEEWQFAITASNLSNPTNFTDFQTAGQQNYLLAFVNGRGEGNFCFNVDFSTLSSRLGLVNNSLATIQLVFNGGDGSLYQCSDLVLIQNSGSSVVPSNITCSNSTSSGSVSLPASGTSGVVSATGSASSGASPSASESGSSSRSASAPSASASNSSAGRVVAGASGLGMALLGLAALL